MRYLLDTNVFSEGMKANPDPAVARWIVRANEQDLALSVIAIMELRQGIGLMPAGKRRDALETWLTDQVTRRFAGRILLIDADIADTCGRLLALNRLGSNVRRIMDIWLAAIALHHGLALVTRNECDFHGTGVSIVNPWTASAAP